MGILKSIKKTFKKASKAFKVAKVFNFLGSLNPWVALGVFAIGWLFMSNRRPDMPDFGDSDFNNFEKGVLLNHQSNDQSIPVVYGERKVGGTRVFIETSGTDNEYLYIALALCEGEIESVDKIYIDDKEVTWSGALTHGTTRTVASSDSNFYKADPTVDGSSAESTISVTWYDGDDDQSYNTTVGALSSWTSNHRLRGVSYLALKFKWNQDCFGGIPNVKALIKGRKVYDPNLDGTKTGGSGSHREDTASTWAYSDNPVLCTLDYMRNARFGMGIANSFFDDDYADWQTAADVCDVDVTPYGSASAIDLLDMNYVLDTKKKCIDNLKEMYIDSALKQEEQRNKQDTSTPAKPKGPKHKITWQQFAAMESNY